MAIRSRARWGKKRAESGSITDEQIISVTWSLTLNPVTLHNLCIIIKIKIKKSLLCIK